MVREEVMAAVAGVCRVVAVAQEAARVEIAAARMKVAATEEAVTVPIVPVVAATAVVADLMTAVGDANGEVTSERSATRKIATYSQSVLARAHRTRRCW